jgi:hypothetical protein
MNLIDILYTLAFCIFLYGASRTFRENGTKSSILIMTLGITRDLSVTLMALFDVPGFQPEQKGFNNYVYAGIILGVGIYLAFISALLVRYKNHKTVFLRLITIIEIAWFVDYVLFFFGTYKIPLL